VSRTLRVGDRVEDLAFLRPDGAPVRLSDFAGPLVLVFLRHLY
jgi:peroxiredoxin